MKQGKYAAPVRRRRRRNTLKPMLIAMAVVLLLGCVTGGTLAWLTSTTGAVTNTFTTSDITITLAETKNDFKMIPGYTIEKDPKVTVVEGSEDCWLFVKIDESSNLRSYVSYDVADGWTPLTADKAGNPLNGVYYRSVMTTAPVKTFSVLAGDKVTVLGTVTKKMMDDLKKDGATQPTLTFQAAAVQLYKSNIPDTDNTFPVAEAYANIDWTAAPSTATTP